MTEEKMSPGKMEVLVEAIEKEKGRLPILMEKSTKNGFPEASEESNIYFPVLSNTLDLNNKYSGLYFSQRRKSSVRMSSHSSLYESEEMDFESSYEHEEGIGLSSSSSFGENYEDSESKTKYNVVLGDQEEKEIERKVKKEFKHDFQNIKKQTREKQKLLRMKFKSKINTARASLLIARANAERKAVDKLQEEAEKKEAGILEKRKNRILKQTPGKDMGDTASELAALRNVRAELDRARARRRSSIASTIVASRRFSIGSVVPDFETKKLENVEEVQKLVFELQKLGLDDAAEDLTRSLHKKKNSEQQLTETLKQEREYAKRKAIAKRDFEIRRLRKEKLEEKEILEIERIKRENEERERLEREKLRRKMAALKRKAFNINMRKNMEESKLVTSISRSYTYSYFDAQ